MKVTFEMDLTIDELCNFYGTMQGMVYAANSLVEESETRKVGSKFIASLASQAKEIILQTDPEKLIVIEKGEDMFKQQLSELEKCN